MEKVDSLTAELDAVGEIVRGWIQGGTPPDAIAVLVHDRYQRQRVAGALTQAGLPAREIDRDRPVPDRVSVLTMHRAKGTEFSKVVLAGVGWTSDAEKRAWPPSTWRSGTMPTCELGPWCTWRPRGLVMSLPSSGGRALAHDETGRPTSGTLASSETRTTSICGHPVV